MTALVRAGWALGAVFFATVLASIAHVDHVGLFPKCCCSPSRCSPRPARRRRSRSLAAHRAGGRVPVRAALEPRGPVGAGDRDARRSPGSRRDAAVTSERGVPALVRAPALLFGLIVAGSMIAGLGVPALRLGPGFRDALATQILREYFVDVARFSGAARRHAAARRGPAARARAPGLATDRAHALGPDRRDERRRRHARGGDQHRAAADRRRRAPTASGRADGARWRTRCAGTSTTADFNAAGSYFAMAGSLAALAIGGDRTRAHARCVGAAARWSSRARSG